MQPFTLPDPEQYPDWQSFARAQNVALAQLQQVLRNAGPQAYYYVTTTPVSTNLLPGWPEGYSPIWYSQDTAELFLANPAYDPPEASDIVYIDTAAIADAAIETNKIDSLAVIESKIANAGVGTTKIQNLAVTEALIAGLAVGNAKIAELAVSSGKIALAAIVTALIGDLQVVTGKMGDLSVNDAKIANLAVTGGKIANLSVGAGHIIDASITNAKIQGIIQSNSWNPTTKAGWQLDKAGVFSGQGIEIYDTSGSLIFGSGGTIWTAVGSKPANLAALSGSEGIQNALVSLTSGGVLQNAGGGTLNLADIAGLINRATQTTGFGGLAALNNVTLGGSELLGFGTLAAISLLTSGNISTYIQSAAIGSALIANLAVGSAHINDLAVTNAKIADATILSAKIASLVVDKIASGTLDAVIDVGDGLLSFDTGSARMVIGVGFGSTDQFLIWAGPSEDLEDMTEANATFYIKTDGSAYFGGALTAGTLTNKITSSSLSTTTSTTLDNFMSNGGNRLVTVSYTYFRQGRRIGDQTAAHSGSMGGTITLSGDAAGSGGAAGGIIVNTYDGGENETLFRHSMSGGFTVTDTSGGLGPISYTAILSAFSEISWPGTVVGTDIRGQTISIVSVEE